MHLNFDSFKNNFKKKSELQNIAHERMSRVSRDIVPNFQGRGQIDTSLFASVERELAGKCG